MLVEKWNGVVRKSQTSATVSRDWVRWPPPRGVFQAIRCRAGRRPSADDGPAE